MEQTEKSVSILWRQQCQQGTIHVSNGDLKKLTVTCGEGEIDVNRFMARSDSYVRILVDISSARLNPGSEATRVSILNADCPFTFFLRDVNSSNPIYIPEYDVIVTDSTDSRDYFQVEKEILGKGLVSDFDRFNSEPEETFEAAAARNRKQYCPTWLGVGRDLRFFRVTHQQKFGYWGEIFCCNHTPNVKLEDGTDHVVWLALGPGANCEVDITRRLEEGTLPILHSTQKEEDVRYNLTLFATREQPLNKAEAKGSDWRACYAYTGGHMLSKEELEELKPVLDKETTNREDQLICCVRVEIVNTGNSPRYAWVKAPHHRIENTYDAENGFTILKATTDNDQEASTSLQNKRIVAGINRFEDGIMADPEMAILLQPGEVRQFVFLIPHYPVNVDKAKELRDSFDFEAHFTACREFWRTKLSQGASISVPEKAIDERIKAGLLHCDIATIGPEKEGPLLATIGQYAPIGSESAPIIQFFDTMGWHDIAERCLDFFIARQRDDGFIQNFARYQLETGPWLWTMGEHYRLTKDENWVRRVSDSVRKGCDYLLAWRERNKKEEYKDLGYYGLIEGKVADPEDFFHSFMLNALSYVGMHRAVEMLNVTEPEFARELREELTAYKKDIKTSFYHTLGRAPVVPVGDGSWAPFPPPCAEYDGAGALYAKKDRYFTHGSFLSRDVLIGTTYLVLGEILDPDEIGSTFILKSNQQPVTRNNATVSQPYYCRHDFMHLLRGEVKPFLKTFYNQLTGLQDGETYTFWEHYFGASQHKTHEEGWFLMQVRWMLYVEYENTLRLLSAVPRRWLEHDKEIRLENVKTHFGELNLHVESNLANGVISAVIRCSGRDNLDSIQIRLPHPEKCRPRRVEGGVYDSATETVTIHKFNDIINVFLYFNQ